MDGFQKLVGLGLKPVQEREMVHVLVDCCLQEKVFNPYYAYLGQKLCEFKKGNQVSGIGGVANREGVESGVIPYLHV